MNDWRGNKIEVGSTIVYASRQRSHMWITEAKVVEIKDGRIAVRRVRASDGAVTEPKRIVYPQSDRLTVI